VSSSPCPFHVSQARSLDAGFLDELLDRILNRPWLRAALMAEHLHGSGGEDLHARVGLGNGIQARDLVRLIRYAAEFGATASMQDRLLAPAAIRKAVQPCSREKIQEIEKEIHNLKAIFDKLRTHPEVRISFKRSDFDLTAEEVELLEGSGIVLQDERSYYMSEIFRLGFGFQLPGGARPCPNAR
jgi:hypothetical protein